MAGLRNSLQLRTAQTQTLTMTPQLQQAIRLLQLSTLDLRQEIQQTVETNPLLEIDESLANSNMESLDALAEKELIDSGSDVFDPFNNDVTYQGSDIQLSATNENSELLNTADILHNDTGVYGASVALSSAESFNHDNFAQNITAEEFSYAEDALNTPEIVGNDLLPDKIAEASIDPGTSSTLENLDSFSRDDNYSGKSRAKNSVLDDDNVYEGETQTTLHEHLLWQLDCSPLQGKDREIAEVIIDAIDDSGYLTEPLEELLDVVLKSYPDTTIEEIQVVLKLIQHYDPLGVGSRTVQECLLTQLNELALTNNSIEVRLAQEVVTNYLHLLSNHDYRSLCSRLGVKEDELKKINDVIISLNPRPGRSAVKESTDFIVPDVLVITNEDGEYDVILNPDALPRVKLNEQYKALVCYARNEREKEFFKSNLQEANWFIQSIAKRNDTLLKVAKCIVDHQKAFLEYGEHRMEPLVLNDIAQEIEMHESTISRVTTEKYLYTPRGTFELKYFFSSHVSTESGGTASSTAIRAEIKSLVASENPRRPYSDNQIAALLKEKGFCVARRTIAKYREALGINSSSQRKRLI